MSDVKVNLKDFKETNLDNDVVKVDLSKPKEEEVKEDAIQERETEEVDAQSETPTSEEVGGEVQEEVREEEVASEDGVVEIGEEEEDDKETMQEEPSSEEKVVETQTKELPGEVEKLVEFINDTGGTLEDYVRLNADYSNVDEKTLLKEYYKQTKPHLDSEEIDFLLEDNFSYDEDMDDERVIKKKKLALKEEASKAKNFLDDLKNKYYQEVKNRPVVSQEQQKAIDFFNRYNKQQEEAKELNKSFVERSKTFMSNDFKGFDFEVGDKKFRYKVKDPVKVAENQSNVNDVLGKFLDERGKVKDLSSYHKALYAASNVDTIANHFYEQGKADAVKDIEKKSRNITSGEVRQAPNDSLFVNGFKVKAVDGVDSSKLKIKKVK